MDLHVVVFDKDGNGVYGPPEHGAVYPADSLTGQGTLGGHRVRCISPSWFVRFHVGYAIEDHDTRDVLALCARFGIAVPAEHVAFLRRHGRDTRGEGDPLP